MGSPFHHAAANPSSDDATGTAILGPPPDHAAGGPDSSFSRIPPVLSNMSAGDRYRFDITTYIPIGCIRVTKEELPVSQQSWNESSQWGAIKHPRDVNNPGSRPYLRSDIQETLLKLARISSFHAIHTALWIRMEFRANDAAHGQIRVYMLPDDIGRGAVDRNSSTLRKAVALMLRELDVSPVTWSGNWTPETPFFHLDPSLDASTKQDPSLFQLFNTLSSPKPIPEVVTEPYSKEAMHRILESDIIGVRTNMHHYQRRSAAQMLQREAQPSQVMDPRLRQMTDQHGFAWYCDIQDGNCYREPRTYEAARGGILAETMGLGKTLICLSLIAATRDITSQIPSEYSFNTTPVRKSTGSLLDMAAATLGRKSVPWKTDLEGLEAREGYALKNCRDALAKATGRYIIPAPDARRLTRHPNAESARKLLLTAATVVVVPSNLVKQWQHEIQKHTIGLKVLVMTCMSQVLPPAEELIDYDIVLFSKQRFDREGRDELPENRKGTLYRREGAYDSLLKNLHFKRLIIDEGHGFGNSSRSSRTEGLKVVDMLQLSARWIISGTPTKNLYGEEVAAPNFSKELPAKATLDELLENPKTKRPEPEQLTKQQMDLYDKQERKDIEKLGNIAISFLKAKPWSIAPKDVDHASWSQLVMQPRHGSKSRGNLDCLKATLEGMIIRHRPEDVLFDVTLPPLYQKIVLLDGSMQNKLALNTFSMMIVTNAVTSERKDADYFFHPRQRKNLQQLVSNLRQASFFWSGFEADHVRKTIEIGKKFLQEKTVAVTPEDEALLQEAIKAGENVLANDINKAISKYHEMPMHIQNELSYATKIAWALDGKPTNPTLMGARMVQAAQTFVHGQLWKDDPTEGLLKAGKKAMRESLDSLEPSPPQPRRRKSLSEREHKAPPKPAPALAGGVTVGDDSSPRKRPRLTASPPKKATIVTETDLLPQSDSTKMDHDDNEDEQKQFDALVAVPIRHIAVPSKLKSILKKTSSIAGTIPRTSPLATTTITSTASTKLSYLISSLILHSPTQKTLIFYEADAPNTAFYIAQSLEILGIPHLIYDKSLKASRRAQYVVSFNQSETFRVLLMDVSQAAYGLDLSSASRVYFVNPVFDPRVEAQAVKRAHRIGQTKPVYVETLVLKGSIEEVILDRRKDMSSEELGACKSILDDRTMYDWIRNVKFVDVLSNNTDGPSQMASLATPINIFGPGKGVKIADPDADLVAGERFEDGMDVDGEVEGKKKQKRTVAVPFGDEEVEAGVVDRDQWVATDSEGARSMHRRSA